MTRQQRAMVLLDRCEAALGEHGEKILWQLKTDIDYFVERDPDGAVTDEGLQFVIRALLARAK
jgi:hypothetical protein